MQSKKMHPAEEICYVMKRAYQRNMVSSAGGCLSVRDEEGYMWISPTSQDKGNLQPEWIAKYDTQGNQLSDYAGSMEWDNHLAIYNARPDVKAIFHTHSSAMLSIVFAREPLATKTFAGLAAKYKDKIAQIPFSIPGSEQLCSDIVKAVKNDKDILTLDSHGTYILCSSNLFDAFKVQDFIEMTARTQVIAPALGNLLPDLTEEQIKSYVVNAENEVFDVLERKQETLTECAARKQLCILAKRGYENRVIDCLGASFSLRLGEDDFIITPADGDIANLKKHDIIRVKNGKIEEGKVAPERTAFHRAVYLKNSEVGSVLVGAPAYAAAYCITDAKFDCSIDPELTFCIKGVEKYTFGTPYEEIAAGFHSNQLAAIVEHDFIAAAAVNGVKTLGIFECMDYATRSVVEMSIRNRKPVQIAEYLK